MFSVVRWIKHLDEKFTNDKQLSKLYSSMFNLGTF